MPVLARGDDEKDELRSSRTVQRVGAWRYESSDEQSSGGTSTHDSDESAGILGFVETQFCYLGQIMTSMAPVRLKRECQT